MVIDVSLTAQNANIFGNMKHYEGITEEQQKQLIDIFTNCPLCVIRDTLIDAKIIDEDFPILYNSIIGYNKTIVKVLPKKIDTLKKK